MVPSGLICAVDSMSDCRPIDYSNSQFSLITFVEIDHEIFSITFSTKSMNIFLFLHENMLRYSLETHGRGASNEYGKCPKNSNTKASDKMTYADSVDPD